MADDEAKLTGEGQAPRRNVVLASGGAAQPASHDGPVCAAFGCKEPATRVIHGKGYCSEHREGSEHPEVAIVRCSVSGCGSINPSPAVGYVAERAYCADHLPHAQHGRVIQASEAA
ncbi:MAG TPA: hypothetical protein VNF04_07560 [Stellaceae bacterium]|nr:hypothetical protein [Stellaceae bacterium]